MKLKVSGENGAIQSMAYYFIKRMNLDLPDLPPARAQICLENLEEVKRALEEVRGQSKGR